MPRYYDMDELAKLCEAKADMAIGDAKIVFASVARWLSLLPPADVVEVVRCKDCVKRDTGECAMSYECSCGGQWSWEVDNGFCVFGERKSQDDRTP